MTGKWFEIKCISVFTWFQPSNLRDNLLNYNTDTKSNFWLKTNIIFFLYEFDLSLFTLQYNYVISIFKSIFINFHEETQNAVQWYWICETSCKEITWFATKFCIPLVLPSFAGKTKFISLKSNYFSQISQSTRLKLKIFLLLLWTPVLKYRFSLYIVNLKEVGHNEIL